MKPFVPSLNVSPLSTLSPEELPSSTVVQPVTLTATDGAASRGLLWTDSARRATCAIHMMHPRADQGLHYAIPALLHAGFDVLARSSRWPNNDVATIHELLVLDVAAGIRELRDRGYASVVLFGSSGGGPLAAFYQAQAQTGPPGRLVDTPAGDPCDLNSVDLPEADGLVLFGTHIGEGYVMGKLLDPAVVREEDPLLSDPELDMYDERNGYVSPPQSSRYSPEFLARYRAAQLERAKRLDIVARDLVQHQQDAEIQWQASGAYEDFRPARLGWHMVVYRTMADPAFVDLSIEPDDRIVQSYGGSPNPRQDNYGDSGFGRYLTPRAWLSTWSPASTRVDLRSSLSVSNAPLLLVHLRGDCGFRLSEVESCFSSAAAKDKELIEIPRTDHYSREILTNGSLGARQTNAADAVVRWMRARFA